jgi:hypothetical protein
METWADQMGQFVSLRSSLENLLEYTQKLVAIYPEALKAASSRIDCPNADDACQVPDCIHRDGFSKAAMPEPTLDYALLSLLMSCHLRLVDIVETLVGHGRMCAHVVASLPPEHEPSFDVPDIRIGSFVAPRDTAASMLVSMLVELQMVLVSKSRDLSVIASRVSGSTEKQASVLKLQCEILCDRTVSALSQLASLREGLTRKGLMR